jgi:FAD/FMN-containing dehydrogenase
VNVCCEVGTVDLASGIVVEGDSDAVCQAGVKWVDLNEALKEQGWFWMSFVCILELEAAFI